MPQGRGVGNRDDRKHEIKFSPPGFLASLSSIGLVIHPLTPASFILGFWSFCQRSMLPHRWVRVGALTAFAVVGPQRLLLLVWMPLSSCDTAYGIGFLSSLSVRSFPWSNDEMKEMEEVVVCFKYWKKDVLYDFELTTHAPLSPTPPLRPSLENSSDQVLKPVQPQSQNDYLQKCQ